MKSKIVLWLIAGILILTFAAYTGCGEAKEKDSSGEASVAQAKTELIIAQKDKVDILDPHNSYYLRCMRVYMNIFDALLKQDAEGNLTGALAEKWNISDDGLVYTFNLRKDVKFHNDDPFTSENCVYSYKRAMASPFCYEATDPIASVRAVDEYTFEVILKMPYSAQLPFFATTYLAIVNQKVVEEKGDNFSINPDGAGTGAYKFKEYNQGSNVILEANEEYWGQVPAIKKIIYQTISEASAGAISLEAGDVDVFLDLQPQDAEILQSNSEVAIYTQPSYYCEFIAFNVRNKPLDDTRVREAIALSIDKNDIIAVAADSIGGVATGTLVSPKSFGYDKTLEAPYPKDLEKAKKLLTDAGGIESGISLKIVTTAGFRSRIAEAYQASLKELGIKASIETLEVGAFSDAVKNGNGDIFISGMTTLAADADPIMASTLAEVMAGYTNYGGWVNADFERMLTQERADVNESSRLATLLEMQKLVYKEVPIVPSYFRVTIDGAKASLKNFKAEAHNLIYLNELSW